MDIDGLTSDANLIIFHIWSLLLARQPLPLYPSLAPSILETCGWVVGSSAGFRVLASHRQRQNCGPPTRSQHMAIWNVGVQGHNEETTVKGFRFGGCIKFCRILQTFMTVMDLHGGVESVSLPKYAYKCRPIWVTVATCPCGGLVWECVWCVVKQLLIVFSSADPTVLQRDVYWASWFLRRLHPHVPLVSDDSARSSGWNDRSIRRWIHSRQRWKVGL